MLQVSSFCIAIFHLSIHQLWGHSVNFNNITKCFVYFLFSWWQNQHYKINLLSPCLRTELFNLPVSTFLEFNIIYWKLQSEKANFVEIKHLQQNDNRKARRGRSRECKHLDPQGIFRWLMTIIIVTNEFVQLNEILSLIWSYVKEAPQFRYSKRRSRYSTQFYISRLRIFLVLSVVRLRRTLRLV